jgi:glycosyltransferase involved in cell wall biosynthesis
LDKIQPYLSLLDVQTYGVDAILLWVFLGGMAVFLSYYVFIFSRLTWYKPKQKKVDPDPVSVIIASRDDADMLREHLPLIMNQKDITYEVIVVDDCSVDDTIDVTREYCEKYPNFRTTKLVENGEFEGGKKYAVTIGIKAAKYSNLVFIDADCYPNSENWLRKMAESLMYKRVVLGYGPFKKEKGFLNMIIRFDTFKIAMQYLSYALSGIPYMGVGRNLAYHSYLYFDAGGFTSHSNVVSGDDDLFVNEVSTAKNTGIEIDPDAFVYSISKRTYAKWQFQKRRHLTTAPKYKFYHKALLLLFPVSQYLMNLAFAVLLLRQFEWQVILALYGFKVLVQGVIQFFVMRKLKVTDLFLWSFVLEFALMLFYPWVSFLNSVNEDQRRRWI